MRVDENLVLHLLAASPGNRYQDTSGKYTISFCGAARPTPALAPARGLWGCAPHARSWGAAPAPRRWLRPLDPQIQIGW